MIKVFKHYNVLTIVSLSLIISIVAIVSAWIIEFFAGYEPCELCLIQRIPYYIGIPLAAASIFAIISGFKRYLTAIILFISCVLMLANFGLAFYHYGLEMQWWYALTGTCGNKIAGMPLTTDKLISVMNGETNFTLCGFVSFELFGLSLAGWNVITSLVVAGLNFIAALKLLGIRGQR